MGAMATVWLFEAMFISTMTLTSAEIMNQVFRELSTNSSGCPLPDDDSLSCYSERGLPVPVVDLDGKVFSGLICWTGIEQQNVYHCEEGGWWVQSERLQLNTVVRRVKRGWFRRAVSWVGNTITKAVDWVGERVGKFICHFFCIKYGGSSVSLPPPNTAPSITCPNVSSPQWADSGETNVRVTWKLPTVTDKEDGGKIKAILTSGIPSGSSFEEGNQFAIYQAKDSGDLFDYCVVQFIVKVHRCLQPRWPRYGTMQCTKGVISGSVCSFQCDEGYDLTGTSSVTCNQGTWSEKIPQCKAKSCGQPTSITHGLYQCTGEYVYRTFCMAVCNPGYSPMGLSTIICRANGQWSGTVKCADRVAPEFDCPEDIEDFADKTGKANISWTDPQTKDNSKGEVTIASRPQSGSRFPSGRHKVTVTATDEAENTARCHFWISVKTITCDSPNIDKSGKDLMSYSCGSGVNYGSVCKLSCKSNYPLEGPSQILCDRDNSTFPPKGVWTWPKDALTPYCKVNSCSNLTKPRNGALACDRWSHGRMCMMLCNGKYDVPRNAPDQFVCGESTGRWRPSGDVPDCTAKRKPGSMHLRSQLYYYTGNCSEQTTKQQIAEKFIAMLKGNALFIEKCGVSVPECKPEFVSVKCGPVSSRRKRRIHIIDKRGIQNAVVIDFDIVIPYVENGKQLREAIKVYEKDFNDIMSIIEEAVSKKTLDIGIPGLVLRGDSLALGVPNFVCGKGMKPVYKTASCSGCPTGTHYNKSIDDCSKCPKGYYQEHAFSSNCSRCPDGMSTNIVGARKRDNCTAMCNQGQYSSDGMEPCVQCDTGSFQPTRGMTSCLSCPIGKLTLIEGATKRSDCVSFDVKVASSKSVVFGNITDDLNSLTYYTWLYFDGEPNATVVAFNTGTRGVVLSVQMSQTLQVDIGSEIVTSSIKLSSKKWHHISFTLDGARKELKIYRNGHEELVKGLSTLARPIVLKGADVTALVHQTRGLTYSGINIVSSVLKVDQLKNIGTKCDTPVTETSFRFGLIGGKVIQPSRCDAYDDCASSPCGRHDCSDEVGGYTCNCVDGFTGINCEVPPDHCDGSKCANGGECVNNIYNYTCSCVDGYRGHLCEEKIVNGGWGQWSDWSACSATCGGGSKQRHRKCNSPLPDSDGKDCVGGTTETEVCNADECPSCHPLQRSYGVVKHCNESESLIQCTISCEPGLAFVEEILPIYECGQKTDYTWNHQTENNPFSRVPACSDIKSARGYNFEHTLNYPNMPCTATTNKEAITDQINQKLSNLRCVEENTCETSVGLAFCDHPSTRKKRDITVSPVQVTFNMKAQMGNGSSLDLQTLYQNRTVTLKLNNYLNKMIDIEVSAQEVVNNSVTIFTVTVGGKNYTVDPTTAKTRVNIDCPGGTVPADGACGECPTGTKEMGGWCALCGKGTYQDETASTRCKQCPKGTTDGLGAREIHECKDSSKSEEAGSTPRVKHTNDKESTESSNTLMIILSVVSTVCAVTILGAVILWMVKTKRILKRAVDRSFSQNKVGPDPPPYTEREITWQISE